MLPIEFCGRLCIVDVCATLVFSLVDSAFFLSALQSEPDVKKKTQYSGIRKGVCLLTKGTSYSFLKLGSLRSKRPPMAREGSTCSLIFTGSKERR